jgi:hypothetical protein
LLPLKLDLLTEPQSKRFPGTMNNKRRELIKYSYWSCLQLERFTFSHVDELGTCTDWWNSDILAEMQLPQSGISRYESFMNAFLPDGVHFFDEGNGAYQTDQMVDAVELKYYWAQIHLRITLNSVHNSLYHKDAPTSRFCPVHIRGVMSIAFPAADSLQHQWHSCRSKRV